MFGQNLKSVVASLAVGVLLTATPISSIASAQEAITLETIGAVRIARPDENRRANTERDRSLAPCLDQQVSQQAQSIRSLTC